jgi:hypothetical protein
MSATGPPLGWRAAAASTTPDIPYMFTPASFLTNNNRSHLLDRFGLGRPFRSNSRADPGAQLHLKLTAEAGSQPWTIATTVRRPDWSWIHVSCVISSDVASEEIT